MEKRAERGKKYGFGTALTLNMAANLTGWWPTPMAQETGRSERSEGQNGALQLNQAASLATWTTPTDDDASNGTRASGTFKSLTRDVMLASWATPVAEPANGTPEAFLERKRKSVAKTGKSMGIVLSDLQMQAQLTATGEMPNGSTAKTENTGQLNPEHSRWLMGLPAAWGYCGATVMRSSARSRKSLSKAT